MRGIKRRRRDEGEKGKGYEEDNVDREDIKEET
jgi:hypothetical protein